MRMFMVVSLVALLAASRAAEPASSDLTNAEIYARADLQFRDATFFKPLETATNDVYFSLAPLLIQQASTARGSVGDVFGALCFSNGVVTVKETVPTIYYFADAVELNHAPHARLAYLWFYQSRSAQGVGFAWQGVRLTLSTNGQPVIWEALTDRSGKNILFVSQSLESAAKEQYGQVLPGRKYAIERSADMSPGTVVARVIDEGPLPMGPILYVQPDDRQIGTLICRCMPAQAKKLSATLTYELHPFPTTESLLVRAQGQPTKNRFSFWPGDEVMTNSVANSLRLPTSF